MDPQAPPSAPSAPATFLPQHHHYDDRRQPYPQLQQPQQQQHHHNHYYSESPERPTDDDEYVYNEKDSYTQHPDPPRSHRASKGSNGRGHDSVISHPFSPKASSPPSPSSSISSGRRKHQSIDEIQYSRQSVNLTYPPRAYIDPEKAAIAHPHVQRSSNRGSSSPDATAALYDSGEYHEKGPEEKPVQLLLYLSGPCVLLSFVITLWTFFSVIIALLLQPFRLFTTRPPLSSQLITFLAPPLNLQLHLIYSYSSSTDYSPAMLVIVHLFSPVVSAGVAIAAWTAACFWFFSAILGDPAGQDGRNDGKESILGVRNWWDRWLSRGLR